jgi:hypothetical protein
MLECRISNGKVGQEQRCCGHLFGLEIFIKSIVKNFSKKSLSLYSASGKSSFQDKNLKFLLIATSEKNDTKNSPQGSLP